MRTLKEIAKEATAGLGDAPDFADLNQALNWLQENLTGNDALTKKLAGDYRNLVLAELSAHFNQIKQGLAKAGFETICEVVGRALGVVEGESPIRHLDHCRLVEPRGSFLVQYSEEPQ